MLLTGQVANDLRMTKEREHTTTSKTTSSTTDLTLLRAIDFLVKLATTSE